MLLEEMNWRNSCLLWIVRWKTNLEKISRSAKPGDIETILEDLEKTRARHRRPQLKDLSGAQDSA